MGLALSSEYKRLLEEGQDLARQTKQSLNTAHLLLALFTKSNQAVFLLEERQLNEDVLLENMRGFKTEPDGTLKEVRQRAESYGRRCGSRDLNAFHLLMALCRVQSSIAYRVMHRSGLDVATVRTQALSYVTGTPPRRKSNSAKDSGKLPQAPLRERPQRGRQPEARRQPSPSARQSEPQGDNSKRPAERQAEAQQRRPQEPLSKFELQRKDFPTLSRIGRNLTLLAEEGELDPLVGRRRELNQMIDILGKRRANNPCLVGEPGVGKTAIVEGLARMIVSRKGLPRKLYDRVVVELDAGGMVSGTQLRGSFSEKMQAIKNEVRAAKGRVVIFIDEIHTIIGAGASDGPLDAANELKSALARGEFPCIGATTTREYKKYIESDPALERRFQPVLVDEPNHEETLTILDGVIRDYESHHHVRYAPEALLGAVRLTDRYVTDRRLPDKAIHVLDLAGARVARQGRSIVMAEDIALIVSDAAQIPLEKLMVTDGERLLQMEQTLRRQVIGHDKVIGRVASVIRRNYAGFSSNRPIGSFLFVGPTGVGKTELVKALAEFLFQSRDAMVRFDMSEYMESHSASKLIGSPPGYVGYEDGGQLTEALYKKPYQVVLFDEVEKASREILNLLLQLLDEGRLTDGRGKVVDFSNTIVVMTTNLGSDVLLKSGGGFGFGGVPDKSNREKKALARVRKGFTPELWNRIDEKLIFMPLERKEIKKIARLQLRESSDNLAREKNITFDVSEAVIEFVLERGGFDGSLGARPMRQSITRLIEAPVAEEILAGRLAPEAHVTIDVSGSELTFTRASRPAAASVQ